MTTAKFSVGFPGSAGIFPSFSFLETNESFATITEPGYLNKVKGSGIELDENYFVFASYGEPSQTQIFVVDVDDGVFTLQTYSPNDNSFEFTDVQFVAKGGSDLNPGDKIGFPKETIQAALNDLTPPVSGFAMVSVMDSGNYEENIVIPPNVIVWAPNATLSATSGAAITLNDTGGSYSCGVKIGSVSASGGATILDLNGPQSTLIFEPNVAFGGNMDVEGVLYLKADLVQFSVITIQATGQIISEVLNAISSGLSGSGNLIGRFSNIWYGPQSFNGKITFNQEEKEETTGRTLNTSDPVSTIQYNSVSDGNYELPQTSDVGIFVGSVVTFVEIGTGRILFDAGAGVTITSVAGPAVRTTGAGAKAFAEKLSDTVWLVSGDIEAQP